MPNDVSCTVNSCTYWEENNRCAADAIHIHTDYAELLRQKSEFAFELAYSMQEVNHSIDTCCQTFKPKE